MTEMTEMTKISEIRIFFENPKNPPKTRFFRGARCTRVKKLLYPEPHQKWQLYSGWQKFGKNRGFLCCEHFLCQKVTLPWDKPKKTLLFRVKKTLYSGWQKFLILSPTCQFLGQKVVYYELYAKKMLVTKMTKKGGFYKVFQNQIIYRKNGQNRKIFHGYFLVEISVILSPCFFLIFFFQFYGEKNKKKIILSP